MARRFSIILLLFVLVELVSMTSCTKKSAPADVTSWTQEGGAIRVSMEDDGNHGFRLVIKGNGALGDYQGKEDAPWYGKSGRVSAIQIEEGITGIGKNAFAAVSHVSEVVLPETVTYLGENSFMKGVKVYGYGKLENHSDAKVHLYSEDQPKEDGLWWHFASGKAQIWEQIRVLFIGNSFTYYNDIDQLVENIAEGAGYTVKTDRIAIGAHNLSQFADPKDEGGKAVEEHLTGTLSYKYVVLQEQSTRPLTGFSFFKDGVTRLVKRIGETQPQAKVYLYSTWGFPKGQGSMTIPEMERKLRDAYREVAKEVGAGISPVGEAFTTVYERYPEIQLIAEDQQHPSYAGSYLSACVHASTLLALDPRLSSFDGLLPPEQAKVLKEVAYETVFKK